MLAVVFIIGLIIGYLVGKHHRKRKKATKLNITFDEPVNK